MLRFHLLGTCYDFDYHLTSDNDGNINNSVASAKFIQQFVILDCLASPCKTSCPLDSKVMCPCFLLLYIFLLLSNQKKICLLTVTKQLHTKTKKHNSLDILCCCEWQYSLESDYELSAFFQDTSKHWQQHSETGPQILWPLTITYLKLFLCSNINKELYIKKTGSSPAQSLVIENLCAMIPVSFLKWMSYAVIISLYMDKMCNNHVLMKRSWTCSTQSMLFSVIQCLWYVIKRSIGFPTLAVRWQFWLFDFIFVGFQAGDWNCKRANSLGGSSNKKEGSAVVVAPNLLYYSHVQSTRYCN